MSIFSKVTLVVASSILFSVGLSTSAIAENPGNVQKLIETGICPGCDLRGADLSKLHLIGADLREADLSGANLAYTNLEGADLSGANLEEANLKGAFLNSAELDDANLSLANLTDANLIQARMEGTNLIGANLNGASFLVESLEEAQLSPLGSAEELGQQEQLSIERQESQLTFPVGGQEQNEFEYTTEYLNEVFEPLEVNRDPSSIPFPPRIEF
ncbi:pentapeptide repeat-containing protein [Limnoraphis robusta Tam1]|uniref:Pentapeptide repeat-containing protein n=1 Tax=Limnoraphis robusta CCNP1315 TaxID=3110306 RepID=A0ABU5TWL2_9CYAN|nr:pentapeptide repeat-containing protein [Limnoraphis robusta]MEA5497728.1 pentapeptide repeat-containing protein [Limnoraphis robusta BA-68 BA1]MEA5519294.1 pentapeptide repeat-containing protein [Limnoraphis robusta CCNP1315]MEA5538054.1 pentapeptide repeat-containing protein [Limnoraphis robusta Tam1]MEA5549036.1 pentapeptide repeat-containing protein [Limnoraphis robusta CCNP1324]